MSPPPGSSKPETGFGVERVFIREAGELAIGGAGGPSPADGGPGAPPPAEGGPVGPPPSGMLRGLVVAAKGVEDPGPIAGAGLFVKAVAAFFPPPSLPVLVPLPMDAVAAFPEAFAAASWLRRQTLCGNIGFVSPASSGVANVCAYSKIAAR